MRLHRLRLHNPELSNLHCCDCRSIRLPRASVSSSHPKRRAVLIRICAAILIVCVDNWCSPLCHCVCYRWHWLLSHCALCQSVGVGLLGNMWCGEIMYGAMAAISCCTVECYQVQSKGQQAAALSLLKIFKGQGACQDRVRHSSRWWLLWRVEVTNTWRLANIYS